MKLRVTIDGEDLTLDLQKSSNQSVYRIAGAIGATGAASVAEIGPGIFSVLLNRKSFTIFVEQRGDEFEVWANGNRHTIAVADARDRPAAQKKQTSAGPMELRAQMPGKVVSILVEAGAAVTAGQGLIVVEAMKMQNEMKSPKDGVVAAIHVVPGAAVAAGERLMVVE